MNKYSELQKEQVRQAWISLYKQLRIKLNHQPSIREFCKEANISKGHPAFYFGSWTNFVLATGHKPRKYSKLIRDLSANGNVQP